MINPGDIITVQALHADGQWYRRWQTTVESIDGICIVTYSPPGSSVEDIGRGQRTHARAVRSHYWFDRLYNSHEWFSAAGILNEIYINVASPPKFVEGGLTFIDHEIDVLKRSGEPTVVLDEDEFEAAITAFSYTAEFVARCRNAAEEAYLLAEHWQPHGL